MDKQATGEYRCLEARTRTKHTVGKATIWHHLCSIHEGTHFQGNRPLITDQALITQSQITPIDSWIICSTVEVNRDWPLGCGFKPLPPSATEVQSMIPERQIQSFAGNGASLVILQESSCSHDVVFSGIMRGSLEREWDGIWLSRSRSDSYRPQTQLSLRLCS